MQKLPLVLAALLLVALGCATTAPAPTASPAAPTTAPAAPTADDPASVAHAINAAMNAGDLAAAMVLVADDAVFKNSPPSRATLTGRSEIQAWVKRQIDRRTTAEISDVTVTGDTAYFVATVSRAGSPLPAGPGAITVTNGKIVLWDFAAQPPS